MYVIQLALLSSGLFRGVLGSEYAPNPPLSLTKVNLNPSNIRYLEDPDYKVWTIPEDASTASGDFNGIDVTLTAGGNSTLVGSYYKFAYARFWPSLGERVVDEGITTKDQLGLPLALTLKGLSPGSHTLLAWHNCWDNLADVSPLKVTVDGEVVATVSYAKLHRQFVVPNWETAVRMSHSPSVWIIYGRLRHHMCG